MVPCHPPGEGQAVSLWWEQPAQWCKCRQPEGRLRPTRAKQRVLGGHGEWGVPDEWWWRWPGPLGDKQPGAWLWRKVSWFPGGSQGLLFLLVHGSNRCRRVIDIAYKDSLVKSLYSHLKEVRVSKLFEFFTRRSGRTKGLKSLIFQSEGSLVGCWEVVEGGQAPLWWTQVSREQESPSRGEEGSARVLRPGSPGIGALSSPYLI